MKYSWYMKKQLIYTALFASVAVLLPSCDDKEKPADKPEAPQQSAEVQPTAPQAPAEPTEEEVKSAIVEVLPECSYAAPGALSMELPQKNEDGTLSLSATLTMELTKNLFARESAPAAFNKEREALNTAANAAMQPESVYLLQVGATTDLITDADREAKPLPENLQTALNELKELADAAVYAQQAAAGTMVEVKTTLRAAYADGKWTFSDVMPDTAKLLAYAELTAEDAVTEAGGSVMSEEFEASRKAEIAEKVAAFNEAAKPYILSREEDARATLTKYQAAVAEEQVKAAEEQAAADAQRQEWENLCLEALADNKNFAGEWVRDNRFGELTLHIEQAKRFDDSIQFFGTIYDTKLPEACLDIAGRCELTPTESGAKVDITIYDGQYDPDQPTAEVYDARDGLLVLHLDKNGKLTGAMTCASWGADSPKAFKVSLAPKAAQSTKDSKKRR